MGGTSSEQRAPDAGAPGGTRTLTTAAPAERPEPPTVPVLERRLDDLGEDDPATLGPYTLLKRVPGGQDTSLKYLARRTDDVTGSERYFVKWVPAAPLPSERHLGSERHAQLRLLRMYLSGALRDAGALVAEIASPYLPRHVEFVGGGDRGVLSVEEFVVGTPLPEYVRRYDGHVLPLDEALAIGRGLLDALAPLHSRRLIHGDVKTSNVIVASDGRVVLTDFETVQRDSATPTQLLGSPYHAAPERGRPGVQTTAVDIFGWGATMAEVVGNLRPYDAKKRLGPDEYFRELQAGREGPYVSSLPPALREAVRSAMHREATSRATAEQLSRLLDGGGTRMLADRPDAEPVREPVGVRPAGRELDVRARYRQALVRLGSDAQLFAVALAGAVLAAYVCGFVLKVAWYALVGAG